MEFFLFVFVFFTQKIYTLKNIYSQIYTLQGIKIFSPSWFPETRLLLFFCLMCEVRLVVLRNTVGDVVKIEDIIIQSYLWWYSHVMLGNIDSQICESCGSWNNWEKEEVSTREIVGRVPKERFGTIRLERRGCVQSKEIVRTN